MLMRAGAVLAATLALQSSAIRHFSDVGARRSTPDDPLLVGNSAADEAIADMHRTGAISGWVTSILSRTERAFSVDLGVGVEQAFAHEDASHQVTEPRDREPPHQLSATPHAPANEAEEMQRLNDLVGSSEEALRNAATERRVLEKDAIARVGSATLRGSVRQHNNHMVASFWDIRFARAERWRHGHLVDVEGGDYTKPPEVLCVQYSGGGFKGTEDCLALDVYVNLADAELEEDEQKLETKRDKAADDSERHITRSLVKAARQAARGKGATAGKPVLVWIHGGAFAFGSKYSGGVSDGLRLAAQQGVVIVCINYRLGPLGFLAHPGLEQMNFGVHDQLLGLQWVNKHIHAFGGDPDRVTIFGQSAGAASVCVHLSSPISRAYFHTAYVGSGNCDGPFFLKSLPQGKAMGRSYVQSMFTHPPASSEQPGDARVVGAEGSNATDHNEPVSATSSGGVTGFLRGLPKLSRVVSWPMQSARSIEVELDPPVGIEEVSQACSSIFGNLCSNDIERLHCDEADDACHGRLLECARRLDVTKVWRNKFGVERLLSEAKAEFGWLYRWLGLSLTGLPVELPWKPLVTVTEDGDDGHEGWRVRRRLSTTGELQHPLQALEQEPAEGIVSLFSFTADEGSIFVPMATLFVPSLGKAFKCDTADPGKLVKQQCDQVTQQFADHVFCNGGKSCDRSRTVGWAYRGGFGIRRIITDYFFACPMLRAADTLARHGLTSYVYKFAVKDMWNSWLPLKHLGACHTVDTYFAFGTGEEKCAGKFTSLCQWNEFHKGVSDELMSSLQMLAERRPLQWDPLNSRGRGGARLWTNEAHNQSIMAMKTEHQCDYLWNEIEGAERWERQPP